MNKKGYISFILVLFSFFLLLSVLYLVSVYYNQQEITPETAASTPSFTQEMAKPEIRNITPTISDELINYIPNAINSVSTESWKTYVDDEFDISFTYPDDWEVTVGYNQDGIFDFKCSDLIASNSIKSTESCDSNVKSPAVKVISNSTKAGLELLGPSSGLGGICVECEIINQEVVINNTQYSIPVKIAEPNSMRNRFATNPDGGVLVKQTGANSMWNEIDLELYANSVSDYATIIKIMESIKPN